MPTTIRLTSRPGGLGSRNTRKIPPVPSIPTRLCRVSQISSPVVRSSRTGRLLRVTTRTTATMPSRLSGDAVGYKTTYVLADAYLLSSTSLALLIITT